MKQIKIMTTEHLRISLKKLRAFHVQRALANRQVPELRKFHREQAKILQQKIKNQKPAAWNWEKFLEAYRG